MPQECTIYNLTDACFEYAVHPATVGISGGVAFVAGTLGGIPAAAAINLAACLIGTASSAFACWWYNDNINDSFLS